MSQKKVEEYKQNKANRNKESKKEVFRRRLELGILMAVVVAGIIWFAVAGITRSLNSKTETIELNTNAIDSYVTNIQTGTSDDLDIELVDDDETLEEETGEE